MIINRHNTSQADYLIKKWRAAHRARLKTIFAILESMPGQLIAVDAGANAGLIAAHRADAEAHCGTVIAFEPQRMIHNALCGSALNDLNNMHVRRQGGRRSGMVRIPATGLQCGRIFGQLRPCSAILASWP